MNEPKGTKVAPSRCIPCPACGGRAFIRRSIAISGGNEKSRYCTCGECACTFVTIEQLSHITGFSETFTKRKNEVEHEPV